jgi:hypothetical protein
MLPIWDFHQEQSRAVFHLLLTAKHKQLEGLKIVHALFLLLLKEINKCFFPSPRLCEW